MFSTLDNYAFSESRWVCCRVCLSQRPCTEQVLLNAGIDFKWKLMNGFYHSLHFCFGILILETFYLTSGFNEDFVLQNNCISEEERDAYEELLTQAEIQGNINKVNSK